VRLSYVIVTRNRRDNLLKTLGILERTTPLPRHAWEAVVVDNGSEDGSPEAVSRAFRDARVVRLEENEGMPARNHGFAVAAGKYVVLIDDDSYPVGRAIPTSLAYLDRHPDTAAIVARVVLPDGSTEGPAMPSVLLGGASVIRKAVLDRVGGFAPEFFRQAEEYDLSFRILAAGHRIERFEDVEFFHEKVPGGRSGALTHRMDLRNNLILVERYLPRELRGAYRRDWIRRYSAFARHDGHADAAERALAEARVWAHREHAVGRRTLPAGVIEALFSSTRRRGASPRGPARPACGGWRSRTSARTSSRPTAPAALPGSKSSRSWTAGRRSATGGTARCRSSSPPTSTRSASTAPSCRT
jgi:GT2 family glycosyltransferase